LAARFNGVKYNMNIIVAVNSDWGIGHDGQQAIVIPEDRRHFKEITDGGIVIVGRKTYDVIGGPLPNRRNIVMTRDRRYKAAGATVAHSVERVLEEIASADPEKVFVVGGGEIYSLFMPMCNTAYVTKIEATLSSDTYFPNLDEMHEWTLKSTGMTHESGGARYRFLEYKRSTKCTNYS